MSLKAIIASIEACLKAMDWLNAYYTVFGVFTEEIPSHIELWNKLLEERHRYLGAKAAAKRTGGIAIVPGTERIIEAYGEVLRVIESNKKLWTETYIRALCPEAKLKEIALQVKARGLMVMPRDEAEKYFDFTRVVPFWGTLPSYTLICFGDGYISFDSPEFDMFEAMCWCYDEAARSKQVLDGLQRKLKGPDVERSDIDQYRETNAHHVMMCKQTLLNAFLFVEASLNSQAYLCLTDPLSNLTKEERLFLNERVLDNDGNERTKFVAFRDKLYAWTKIISPRKITFDRGKNPYQALLKIKEYRDALVHLSAGKVRRLRLVDFEIARQAALTAVEIVRQISEFVAPNPSHPPYPFWLTKPKEDGLFHVTRRFKLATPPHVNRSALQDVIRVM